MPGKKHSVLSAWRKKTGGSSRTEEDVATCLDFYGTGADVFSCLAGKEDFYDFYGALNSTEVDVYCEGAEGFTRLVFDCMAQECEGISCIDTVPYFDDDFDIDCNSYFEVQSLCEASPLFINTDAPTLSPTSEAAEVMAVLSIVAAVAGLFMHNHN